MGLFSFFKKKDRQAQDAPPARQRAGEPSRLDTDAERMRQREIARATAAKIDAIELEMASDIFDAEPAWGSAPRRMPAAVPAAATPVEEAPDAAAMPTAAPVAEESAILYANGQVQAAEQMLRASLSGPGRSERLPWWMLFDLYQASGDEPAFESIAIDYASRFETSPPAFNPLPAARAAKAPFSGLTPTETFPSMLDAQIGAQLQRLRERAAASPVLRLEFGAVRATTADGCARLLAALQALRASEHELVLAGADNLAGVLRPMLAVGARDAGQAPWLLQLELLQLLNREKDFEETAMDYCVTFEVSPPSFEAPRGVATAGAEAGQAGAGQRFMLPPVIAGDCGALLAAIDAYAASADPVVLDCSRLARIDYACAGALHAHLRAPAAAGRRVELREVNHLVAVLFRLLGYTDSARLFAHHY